VNDKHFSYPRVLHLFVGGVLCVCYLCYPSAMRQLRRRVGFGRVG